MDTTGQRATQKINIKLLLSEPTKNKFQKSFPSFSCVCGGVVAAVAVVAVGEGGSLDGREHGSRRETILLIGSNQETRFGALPAICRECRAFQR